MNKSLRRAVLAGTFVVAAGGAYYAWEANRRPPPAVEPPVLAAPVAEPPPAPAAEPAIRHPVAVPTLPAPPLPALDASDAAVGQALAQLLGRKSLPAFFYPDGMIRRFVATIDNLPRPRAPVRMMPVKPATGSFVVASAGGALSIDTANSARYTPYVNVLAAVDVPRLVNLYIRYYPLFQRAYNELGYPKGYFNDRLVEALDDLLAAPDVAPPVGLTQPKVLYEFADPQLESRSAGQKIMIRMGSANAARVKDVLRAIRAGVARGAR